MKVVALLSMLHEEAGKRHSACRLFRGRPVLDWTLSRLSRAQRAGEKCIFCWDDQRDVVTAIATSRGARVISKGPRQAVPAMDALTAARRWADGWRGGLLQTCEFDRGFHAMWAAELAAELKADALLLIDPAAALLDGQLIDDLLQHAEANPDRPLVFSQAAPGLSGVFIRAELLQQLARANVHPGKYLHYQPTKPCRDPIGELTCAPVRTAVARSLRRFTLDSPRQIEWFERATPHLNGQLVETGAEGLIAAVANHHERPAPREVMLEVTTRRATRPIFSPAGYDVAPWQPDLTVESAKKLFAQLPEDVRLTLGGVGDPMLAPAFRDIIDAATAAGVRAIHVRTDLLDVAPEQVGALAESNVDVVSIHIPALSTETYRAVMGVDGLHRVVANVRLLLERRQSLGRLTPIIVPVFTKCRQNLAEMEAWYDKWLAALGSAVIAGASDFGGQISDHATADMSPPRRIACNRLASRLHVLCDGQFTTCEQDFAGRQAVGHVERDDLPTVWSERLANVRADHVNGEWGRHPVCAACREWHRP